MIVDVQVNDRNCIDGLQYNFYYCIVRARAYPGPDLTPIALNYIILLGTTIQSLLYNAVIDIPYYLLIITR